MEASSVLCRQGLGVRISSRAPHSLFYRGVHHCSDQRILEAPECGCGSGRQRQSLADHARRAQSPQGSPCQAVLVEMLPHACHENMGDLIAPREICDRFRYVCAGEDLCFDAKASGKMKVLLHRFAFRGRKVNQSRCVVNKERQTIGLQIIGHSAATANQHNVDGSTVIWIKMRSFVGSALACPLRASDTLGT